MNDEAFERLLRAELESGYSLDPQLGSAVGRKISAAGRAQGQGNRLAVFLICASLIMVLLESLLTSILFGGIAAFIFVLFQISLFNLTLSCCILIQKTERGV